LFLARSSRNEGLGGDVMRLAINAPEGSVAVSEMQVTVPAPQFALSPDGRALVFVAAPDESHSILWLRLLNDTTARQLPGTENASFPFWSPDSRWIGFVSQGKIRKIPASGGAVQVLANAGTPRGMCWGPDDTILFAYGNSGLLRVASTGGAVTEVTKLDLSRQEGSHRWPYFLPDGRHFLYVIRSALAEQQGVYVGSLDGKIKKRLLPLDTATVYASPGYLLYLDGYALLAQAFEPERLEVSGQPFFLAEKVGRSSIGYSSMSVSGSGMLAYSGPTLRPGRLTWLNREGKPAGTVAQEGDYVDFRLSPDGNRVAAALVNPKSGDVNIWLSDISRGSTSRLTSGRLNVAAVWSPDGAKVAYRKSPNGTGEIYQVSASGGGKDEVLLPEELQRTALQEYNTAEPTDWSSDGRHILYSIATSNTQLWLLPLSAAGGVGKPVRLIDSPADVMHGNFSPDGRMIAYSSNESGAWEVYAQTFPLSDRRWLVSINGGYEPRWSADGHEIYYLSKDRKLMAVPVVAGSSFGVPKPLFQTQIATGVSSLNMHYVPGRDGRRFLVNTQIGEPAPNPITIVLNWTAALKK
jgi:Tol biopolymer transport system component